MADTRRVVSVSPRILQPLVGLVDTLGDESSGVRERLEPAERAGIARDARRALERMIEITEGRPSAATVPTPR